MSRWSTPKAYRKFKDSYVNLGDDEYLRDSNTSRMSDTMSTIATLNLVPRKDRRRKPLYSASSDGSYEYTFSHSLDQARQEEESRDTSHFSPSAFNNRLRDIYFSPKSRTETSREDIECRESLGDSVFDLINRTTEAMSFENTIQNDDPWAVSVGKSSSLLVGTKKDGLKSPPRVCRRTSMYDDAFCVPNSLLCREIRYPLQAHCEKQQEKCVQRPRIPLAFQYHKIIGPKSLNIHRLRLPSEYLHLLDKSKLEKLIFWPF